MQTKFKYFTLKELCKSETAERLNIDNFPSFEIVEHLSELVETILDPLRQAWGSGIYVSSGYRSEVLNTAVNGAKTSVHKQGWAADIQPMNSDFEGFKYFVQVWLLKNKVKFDQLLIETNSKGAKWLHIGLYSNAKLQRGQIKNMHIA